MRISRAIFKSTEPKSVSQDDGTKSSSKTALDQELEKIYREQVLKQPSNDGNINSAVEGSGGWDALLSELDQFGQYDDLGKDIEKLVPTFWDIYEKLASNDEPQYDIANVIAERFSKFIVELSDREEQYVTAINDPQYHADHFQGIGAIELTKRLNIIREAKRIAVDEYKKALAFVQKSLTEAGESLKSNVEINGWVGGLKVVKGKDNREYLVNPSDGSTILRSSLDQDTDKAVFDENVEFIDGKNIKGIEETFGEKISAENDADVKVRLKESALTNFGEAGTGFNFKIPNMIWVKTKSANSLEPVIEVTEPEYTEDENGNATSKEMRSELRYQLPEDLISSVGGKGFGFVKPDKSGYVPIQVSKVEVTSQQIKIKDQDKPISVTMITLYGPSSAVLARIRVEGIMHGDKIPTPDTAASAVCNDVTIGGKKYYYTDATSIPPSIEVDSPMEIDASGYVSTAAFNNYDLANYAKTTLGVNIDTTSKGAKYHLDDLKNPGNRSLYPTRETTSADKSSVAQNKYSVDEKTSGWKDFRKNISNFNAGHSANTNNYLDKAGIVFISKSSGGLNITGTRHKDIFMIKTDPKNNDTLRNKDNFNIADINKNYIKGNGSNDIVIAKGGENYIDGASYVHLESEKGTRNYVRFVDGTGKTYTGKENGKDVSDYKFVPIHLEADGDFEVVADIPKTKKDDWGNDDQEKYHDIILSDNARLRATRSKDDGFDLNQKTRDGFSNDIIEDATSIVTAVGDAAAAIQKLIKGIGVIDDADIKDKITQWKSDKGKAQKELDDEMNGFFSSVKSEILGVKAEAEEVSNVSK